jgi:hypothetical protein
MKIRIRPVVLAVLLCVGAVYAGKPLKVYILVGQSNMQGQAMVSSFAGKGMDPKAKPLYDKLVDESGKAMAAPAEMEEFKGNVKAIAAADFWDEKLGEFETRKTALSEKKGKQKDADDKYAALREKISPLQKELAVLEEQTGKGRSKAKIAELEKEIEDTLFTPQELDYIAKNRSSQGYHYNGSAKTYSQVGEALAKAILEMAK